MANSKVFHVENEAALDSIAPEIAALLAGGGVVALKGDLGVGKTALARALIRHLTGQPDLDVPSPTYTLLQTYDADQPIWHFDLYRLKIPDEVFELGWEDAIAPGNLVLIEWAERIENLLPVNTKTISIAVPSEITRDITVMT